MFKKLLIVFVITGFFLTAFNAKASTQGSTPLPICVNNNFGGSNVYYFENGNMYLAFSQSDQDCTYFPLDILGTAPQWFMEVLYNWY